MVVVDTNVLLGVVADAPDWKTDLGRSSIRREVLFLASKDFLQCGKRRGGKSRHHCF